MLYIQLSKWKDNTLSCMGLMDRSDNLTHGDAEGLPESPFFIHWYFFMFIFYCETISYEHTVLLYL